MVKPLTLQEAAKLKPGTKLRCIKGSVDTTPHLIAGQLYVLEYPIAGSDRIVIVGFPTNKFYFHRFAVITKTNVTIPMSGMSRRLYGNGKATG